MSLLLISMYRLLRGHVHDKRILHLVGDMLSIGMAEDDAGEVTFFSDIRKMILLHGRLSRMRQALSDLPLTVHRVSVFLDDPDDEDD